MNPTEEPQSKSRGTGRLSGLLGGLLLLFGGGLTAGAEAATAPFRVVFLPHWVPQAQFAGYYMAEEKGLYLQEGLEVVILDGGPRKPVEKLLISGEATLASHFLSSAIQMRGDGVPLVHLAQVTQRSALMLVAHRSHGIHAIRDLDGRKVSLWPAFSVQPRALFRRHGIEVHTITQGPGINLFMRGGVDAASAMWYNEYHLFLNSGLDEDEVTVFRFDQHELNFPEDSLVCLEATWRANPELCRRFVAASLAGWELVRRQPEESLRVVMRRVEQARTGTNRAHQRWMLERMLDLIQPVEPGIPPGGLSPQAYAAVVRELVAGGEIGSAPAYEEFHVSAHP